MREILFRGKRDDNGEWIESADIMRNTIRGALCLTDARCRDWVNICPETLGQFTGLCDKHGTKIFEGDIIESVEDYDDKFGYPATNYFYSVVIWDEENFCWAFKTGEYVQAFNDWDWDNSIKVGNIHDNPELLTGEINDNT